MLPALELDGRIITESDVILGELEKEFGVLLVSISDPRAVKLRRIERLLFSKWCRCISEKSDKWLMEYDETVALIDNVLSDSESDYFLSDGFSLVDCIFIPFLERMNASLFYYKGYTLRNNSQHPNVCAWFHAIESRSTYRGTQSDFHTHAHDLPPQMVSQVYLYFIGIVFSTCKG